MSARQPALRAAANEFLGCRRLAVVGVSRNPADFTRVLFLPDPGLVHRAHRWLRRLRGNA